MKNIFTFLLIAISFRSFGQSQNDFNFSIGIKALAVEEYPKLLNEVRKNINYSTTAFDGIMLKVIDNQLSYRIQVVSSEKSDYTFDNECATCEEVTGQYKSFDVKLGFERSIVYTKLQPFYGFDLGFKRARFDGQSREKNNNAFLYNAEIEKNGGSINGFLGLKYSIIPQLTISAEAGIDYIYSYDKEIKSTNTNVILSQNKFDRWQFTTKPLGLLSLQFNFGRDF
jgi:hypothetical protein